MRADSKWTTDPEHVQRRRERAYSFIRYAPIHDFVEGPVYSNDEEEEEVSEDGDEVDEEIEAGTPPDATAGTAAETAADTTAGTAAETAAEVAAKTHVPPKDTSGAAA